MRDQSCADTDLIWTGDDIALNFERRRRRILSGAEFDNNANIFCVSQSACSGSTLQASDSIVCSSPNSCKNAFILETSYFITTFPLIIND